MYPKPREDASYIHTMGKGERAGPVGAADDAAARLYGDVLSPELRAACRRNGIVFAVCSGVGLVVQLASLGSAQLYPVCIVLYWLYNICTMVLVRITNAAFKFEDPALLKVCLGMCLATAGVPRRRSKNFPPGNPSRLVTVR